VPVPPPRRLIFVHGAGGTSRGWDLQRLAFPDAVVVDLPGRGGEGPVYRRIEDFAAWLRAAGRAQGWFPAVLAGHSMGGAIALWSALSHPDDLVGLVLISTGARLRVAQAIREMLASDYPAAVDAIITRSLAPGADPRLAHRLGEAMMAVPAEVTAADFQACDTFDVTGRLEEIRIPALVIAAREDLMTPPRYAEFLHAHLAQSRLAWVEGAGHMVHVERPREVNDAIRRFLDDLGARGTAGNSVRGGK
jgi:pimeloyl-ACP methyl ester carboxylesterase